MPKKILTITALAAMCAGAAVPLKWTVATERVTPIVLDAYHGETLSLEANLQSYGKPLATAFNGTFFWQTNGMGNVWWQTNATVRGSAVSADFSPAMDSGADRVSFFFGVTDAAGGNYRASGTLRLKPSPGFAASSLSLEGLQTVNFAHLNVLNAPWATIADIDGVYARKSELPSDYLTQDDLREYVQDATVRDIVSNANHTIQFGISLLEDRVNAIEYTANEALERSPDLSNYAQLSDIPNMPDLTPYATHGDVATNIASATENLDTRISSLGDRMTSLGEAVSSNAAAIANIDVSVDLTNYAQLSDIPDAPDLSPYATHQDVATNAAQLVAQFRAEMANFTPAPDLTGYARLEDIPAPVDLTNYAQLGDIPDPPDLTPYATHSDVATNVATMAEQLRSEIQAIPTTPDLTGYARLEDIPAPVDLTSYAQLSDIPDPPDLSPYATHSDVATNVSAMAEQLRSEIQAIPTTPDLSAYARLEDIPDPVDLTNYARLSDIPDAPDLAPYATHADVAANIAAVAEGVGERLSEIGQAVSDLSDQMQGKQDAGAYVTYSALGRLATVDYVDDVTANTLRTYTNLVNYLNIDTNVVGAYATEQWVYGAIQMNNAELGLDNGGGSPKSGSQAGIDFGDGFSVTTNKWYKWTIRNRSLLYVNLQVYADMIPDVFYTTTTNEPTFAMYADKGGGYVLDSFYPDDIGFLVCKDTTIPLMYNVFSQHGGSYVMDLAIDDPGDVLTVECEETKFISLSNGPGSGFDPWDPLHLYSMMGNGMSKTLSLSPDAIELSAGGTTNRLTFPNSSGTLTTEEYVDQNVSAMQSTMASKSEVESLGATVSAWELNWGGDDVIAEVTNFFGVADIPAFLLKQKTPPDANHTQPWYKTIWDERTRWNRFLSGQWASLTNTVVTYLAERCWGIYDSATGNYSPDGVLQISQPTIQIADGMSYQKTVSVGGAALWVLTANDPMTLSGEVETGFFKIEDGDGNTLFEIIRGDKKVVGATAVEASKLPGNVFRIRYNTLTSVHPTLEVSLELGKNANFLKEYDPGLDFATVTWSGHSGEWYADVVAPGARSLFARASFESGGETYIKNHAPITTDKIIIGGTSYNVKVETLTINGVPKQLMVLEL